MIGLFGGSFDPIHLGHLRPALEVMENIGLSEVRFIPAHQSPLKGRPNLTPKQRANMVANAIAGQAGFELESCELEREGASYTVDTLHLMRQRYGAETPLILMMGTDSFNTLPCWHRWQQILELGHIVIMQRPDAALDESGFPPGFMAQVSTNEAEILRNRPNGHVFQQEVSQLGISSTMIRDRLRAGQSIRFLVPEAQADFIHTNQLYILQ